MTHRVKVLIADDDLMVRKIVASALETSGYEVLSAENGIKALEVVEQELPDIIILDLKMPLMDGYEVAGKLREWSQIPVIVLSGLSGEEEKVKCLNLGADDYLCKPFGTSELVARVNAVLRRTGAAKQPTSRPLFHTGEVGIDFIQRKVTVSGTEIRLTPTEYSLLVELASNAGKVLTYTYLLKQVWGPMYQDEREYLHVFIGRLRAKLEPDQSSPRYIITIPGAGYQLKVL